MPIHGVPEPTMLGVAMSRRPWLFVEIGGSSVQTARQDQHGRFWFSPGLVRDPGCRVALACPGIVTEGRVRYATNLGWSDDADPRLELGLPNLDLVVNDATAAALGEAVLRDADGPLRNLAYVSLGTGIGSAQVVDGTASDLDLGHVPIGGRQYCDGCRAVGCLNSELASARLPHPLGPEDWERMARALAPPLCRLVSDARVSVVLGGGIARRYPAIVAILDRLVPHAVYLTIAPPEAKSSAYAGLELLARTRIHLQRPRSERSGRARAAWATRSSTGW